ncbi:hypothetical protein BOX15_Mlig021314g1 [Macrostomum lignano]|uniref:Uncharacterized protein n=1 Tax=Macrostomum lignano TaxID=282301 RepID=A0A267FI66_9PLAT|nr:hypothetical protein BOX15_Mlig021314g1 [Macrostomum lignano]
MNVSLSESSAYKIWKSLSFMCENSRLIPGQMVCNFFIKYLTTNSYFAKQRGGKTSLPWKSMVKANLTELTVFLSTQNSPSDAVDECKFHRLWQLMHLDNMTVFFEKIIELIDESAPLNDYVLTSKRMFAALSSVVKPEQASVIDFLHYICYFYCGTSPGFLHKHETILLLQDICRDWGTIFDRIYSFLEVHNQGAVTSELIETRCPMLPIEESAVQEDRNQVVVVSKEDFCNNMRQKIPAVLCGCKIEIIV